MLDKFADIMYLIMGTNPFPNIISAITRLKKGGKIICIGTQQSLDRPYKRFKNLLHEKGLTYDIENIPLTYKYSMRSIIKKLGENITDKLKTNGNIGLVEVNFNGGSKVMSSSVYDIFKNLNNNGVFDLNLEYIDPEKGTMYCEYRSKDEKDYKYDSVKLSELTGYCSLTVEDIISTYLDKSRLKCVKCQPSMTELSNKLGQLLVTIKDKNNYNKIISFYNSLYAITFEKDKLSQKDIENFNQLFKESAFFDDFTDLNSFGFKKNKDILNYFKKTVWLEEYILNILIELKKESIIDDAIANVDKKYDENNKDEFEVDLVAYRRYKLFAISVTSSQDVELAKGKLYEIKQRAKYLAGDEAGVCVINLCWDADPIIHEYENIWDDNSIKNTLILSARDFPYLKDKLKKWFMEV